MNEEIQRMIDEAEDADWVRLQQALEASEGSRLHSVDTGSLTIGVIVVLVILLISLFVTGAF